MRTQTTVRLNSKSQTQTERAKKFRSNKPARRRALRRYLKHQDNRRAMRFESEQ